MIDVEMQSLAPLLLQIQGNVGANNPATNNDDFIFLSVHDSEDVKFTGIIEVQKYDEYFIFI